MDVVVHVYGGVLPANSCSCQFTLQVYMMAMGTPRTVSEIEQISQLLSDEERVTLPPEDDTLLDPQAGATVTTILDNLRGVNIFHLASHGTE